MVDLTHPPFHERHFTSPDGRRWGVYATNPASIGRLPPARFLVFACEDGEQRQARYDDMGPGHQDISEETLLRIWAAADVTGREVRREW